MGLGSAGSGRVNKPGEVREVARRARDQGQECVTLHAAWGLKLMPRWTPWSATSWKLPRPRAFPLYIETHRATLTDDIWHTVQLVKRIPEIRFNGDFSHWYTGHEMRYGDIAAKFDFCQSVFDRVRFLHGRIGDPCSIQVDVGDGQCPSRRKGRPGQRRPGATGTFLARPLPRDVDAIHAGLPGFGPTGRLLVLHAGAATPDDPVRRGSSGMPPGHGPRNRIVGSRHWSCAGSPGNALPRRRRPHPAASRGPVIRVHSDHDESRFLTGLLSGCLLAAACSTRSTAASVPVAPGGPAPPTVRAEGSELFATARRPVDARARDLLSRLTLEEKIVILHADGGFTATGIPRFKIRHRWLSDGPQGVHDGASDDFACVSKRGDFATAMPANLGLAATFDPELAKTYGSVIGEEALARGKDIMLCPGLNIMRTPLGGRNCEYFGEDPFLAGRMAVGYIEGMQAHGVAACAKHFAANNQESNRNGVNVEMDDRTLHEIYLPAFKAAVTEAHVWSVMSAYNSFRGQFCSENDLLLNQILKRRLGVSRTGHVRLGLHPFDGRGGQPRLGLGNAHAQVPVGKGAERGDGEGRGFAGPD